MRVQSETVICVFVHVLLLIEGRSDAWEYVHGFIQSVMLNVIYHSLIPAAYFCRVDDGLKYHLV